MAKDEEQQKTLNINTGDIGDGIALMGIAAIIASLTWSWVKFWDNRNLEGKKMEAEMAAKGFRYEDPWFGDAQWVPADWAKEAILQQIKNSPNAQIGAGKAEAANPQLLQVK
jgi:hypothetical protein